MKNIFADKKFLIKALLYVLLAVTITIYSTVLYNNTVMIKQLQAENNEMTIACQKPMISGEALFCLYECGGKVGIYDAKSNILVDIIDVFVYSLPEGDRKLLKSGIEVYSFSDLSKIIEDLTS